MCRARLSRVSSDTLIVLDIQVAARTRNDTHSSRKNSKHHHRCNHYCWEREALMRPEYPHMLLFYYTKNHLAMMIMA